MNCFENTYYDHVYANSKEYAKHYRDVVYYPVWKEIMDSLQAGDRVLDIGCGPGHFGHMLMDGGIDQYVGIDFSAVAVMMAKKKMPTARIIQASITDGVSYDDFMGYTVTAIEVLEHIEDDIALIKKLPKGKIIFSVPNYNSNNHYRAYADEEFILDYYRQVIEIDEVVKFEMSKTSFIYVCKGKII